MRECGNAGRAASLRERLFPFSVPSSLPLMSHRSTLATVLGTAALLTSFASAVAAQSPDTYRAATDRLIDAATKDSAAWNRIAELTDTFGSRIAGSEALERAIDWTLARMRADGLENVRGEPAMRLPKVSVSSAIRFHAALSFVAASIRRSVAAR